MKNAIRGMGVSPVQQRLQPQSRGRDAHATIVLLVLLAGSIAHAAPEKLPPLISGNERNLQYRTDDRGNRVPDFSYAGYCAGNNAIPDVPVRVVVSPVAGDNTARIQSAIDYIASLPLDQRGAVLLLPGKFEINGGLWIKASGVVLRGSGIAEAGTQLIAAGHDRRTLITIVGKPDRKLAGSPVAIADAYAPVHSTRLKLADAGKFKVGDTVLIRRPATAEWIAQLRLTDKGDETGLSWKPGTRDFAWDRTVTAVNENEITFDGPITTAIDAEVGGGSVVGYTWPGRISDSGVENLRCDSVYDTANPKDEAHSWMAVTMEHAQDCWVRQVTMSHFAGSTVSLWETCRRITVEDCKSLDPISEIAGYRRHTFFTAGTQTLFARCYSENGRHDFAVGFCAPGPNAFVQCEAQNPLDDSGPIDSWASGVLFDNVRIDGNAIFLGNRGHNFQHAGWGAANSLAWQCSASLFVNSSPAGASNWSVGCWGQFEGNGYWQSVNEFVRPVSLYYAQLAQRLGADVSARAQWMAIPNDASTNPTIEQAAKLISESTGPAPQLALWIDQASKRHAIPVDPAGAKKVEEAVKDDSVMSPLGGNTIAIRNGWIAAGDTLPLGGRLEVMWWRGSIRPGSLGENTPCITRYVPGRNGWGLTDDLGDLTDSMVGNGQVALTHHYALWYDRRNDDHERVRRMNGDAWPPFYDLPFARSGQGTAWDGLSKYDLTKYNPWYWDRLKEFATLCDQKGLVLIHENFFQHNIIEAGAHWASCPWRSANNINNTGFPEPPPYAGDKRIFMSEQFYDVTNPVRREIYRKYIRQCLDNFTGNSNVIQMTSGEFTGPLAFTQFWIDCVAEWEKETGKKPIIAISATQDVQDAILADPVRSPIVSVIDINYWWYQANGQAYAPKGGLNMSPRQLERLLKPRASTPEQVYHAIREYREKYPDKAVMYSSNGQNNGWAQLFAGGSLPQLRATLAPELQAAIIKMKPADSDGPWMLSDGGQNYLIAGTTVPKSIDASAYNQHQVEVGRGQTAIWLSKK